VTGHDRVLSAERGPRGTLYVVATPIGNLDDLSPRAVEAFSASDLVACEDTRRSRILLSRHGLKTPLLSYHKFNEMHRLPDLLDALRRGRSVTLVSDGGTPGISDPGAKLVRAAREAGHRVVPIPGPSAVTALLSASGLEPGPFTFIGFLPHRKGERRRALEALRAEPRPLLFFESPRRVVATLEDALAILGDREAFLGREMTKLHEEFVAGTIRTVLSAFAGREVRGEVAFLLGGAGRGPAPAGHETVPGEAPGRRVYSLIQAGLDRKEAMRRVARETGLSRRDLYRMILREREDEE
jgi:16S rRNA (cytidine1402-2'-O)-methyltransferase